MSSAEPYPDHDRRIGWTIAELVIHYSALREADLRFNEERDRRYAEVATEREKALKIKETADLAALGLARDIQEYKDERDNRLREQIDRERGTYATQTDLKAAVDKVEALVKPLAEYVVGQQGRHAGISAANGTLVTIAIVGSAVASLLVNLLTGP